MKNLRRIRVRENQQIGEGSFGIIYRISKTKIVKAFYRKSFNEQFARDEVRGSKLFKGALPILEVVIVILPNKRETIGLIKKYIPHSISSFELLQAIHRKEVNRNWDSNPRNFRKDDKGKIWRIDTQTKAAQYYYEMMYPW